MPPKDAVGNASCAKPLRNGVDGPIATDTVPAPPTTAAENMTVQSTTAVSNMREPKGEVEAEVEAGQGAGRAGAEVEADADVVAAGWGAASADGEGGGRRRDGGRVG
ncbi:hypothetical protein CYMTET_33331 [Cymbomonas tetramitiformis]|uniref:Uncharacterized protein n=1 Tax=Cymbomonas tetramitiformis TaxID=36881 RepID=A0AAE0FDC2_9CHLO|nr:hypothetical protein CYMTET_33331 [Cymbomonas tetramitiformis]